MLGRGRLWGTCADPWFAWTSPQILPRMNGRSMVCICVPTLQKVRSEKIRYFKIYFSISCTLFFYSFAVLTLQYKSSSVNAL